MNTETNNSVAVTPDETGKRRLHPVKRALFEENVSFAQLAQACKCSKQNMSLRFINDDCKLSDMEKMAEAIGYDFSWTFTKKKKSKKAK